MLNNELYFLKLIGVCVAVENGKPEEICRLYFDKKINDKMSNLNSVIVKHESFMRFIKGVGSIAIVCLISLTGFFVGQNSAIATTNANIKNVMEDVRELKISLDKLLFSKENHPLITETKH